MASLCPNPEVHEKRPRKVAKAQVSIFAIRTPSSIHTHTWNMAGITASEVREKRTNEPPGTTRRADEV